MTTRSARVELELCINFNHKASVYKLVYFKTVEGAFEIFNLSSLVHFKGIPNIFKIFHQLIHNNQKYKSFLFISEDYLYRSKSFYAKTVFISVKDERS